MLILFVHASLMRNIVLFVFSVHYILFANYSEFIAQMICNCAKKSLSLHANHIFVQWNL